MTRSRFHLLLSLMLALGCAQKKNAWDDLDYSSVYRKYGTRELDRAYTPPSVLNCVNDDLYNCNP